MLKRPSPALNRPGARPPEDIVEDVQFRGAKRNPAGHTACAR